LSEIYLYMRDNLHFPSVAGGVGIGISDGAKRKFLRYWKEKRNQPFYALFVTVGQSNCLLDPHKRAF